MQIQQNQVNPLVNRPKRQSHDYTSELELKSLLIRIKNSRFDLGKPGLNNLINKRIKLHTLLGEQKYECTDTSKKRTDLRRKIYDNVVKLSEKTKVDDSSYERFGEIILLMITRILTLPKFSGYSYRHDFYSDAVYKIVKYLHNFDHKLISERSGLPVNAFAYISQYIHNSVIYIIGRNKKENDNLKELVKKKNIDHSHRIKGVDIQREIEYVIPDEINIENIHLKDVNSMLEEIKRISEEYEDKLSSTSKNGIHRLNIYYPKDYLISFDEYNELRNYLKPQISILRES